ncbi:MAG: diaminopimelate epimerase [Acetobacteraceae bacterium]|nr:diaminopimelate epimerase [Acetobacteraceae bacterium]
MHFAKMEALGNDYIFLDLLEDPPPDEGALPRVVQALCDRHLGVGGDGVVLLLPSAEGDFRMRVFNPDGGEAEMCGTGACCSALYLYQRGRLGGRTRLRLETLAGPVTPELVLEGGRVAWVKVGMGFPRLRRRDIPMLGRDVEQVVDERLQAAGKEFFVTCVSMGNPHCVVFVEDLAEVELGEWGRGLETHPVFPHRANVEFVQVLGLGRIRVLVWERGSGPTLSCGTGACASAVASIIKGLVGRQVAVEMPGGELRVEWPEGDQVWLKGPCREVFRGEIRLDLPAAR